MKDNWDKLKSASGLLTAIAVAVIGGAFTYVYRVKELDLRDLQEQQGAAIRIAETIQGFMPHLTSEVEREREVALLAIATLGDEALATKLANLLRSEGAISALAKIAATDTPAAELAMNSLVDVLADPSEDIQAYATHAIVSLDPNALNFIPRLKEKLESPDIRTRERAAISLDSLGRQTNLLFSDRNPNIRAAAALTMGNLGVRAEPYAAELAGLVADMNPRVQQTTVRAFETLGVHGRPGLDTLRRLEKDNQKTEAARRAAAEARKGVPRKR